MSNLYKCPICGEKVKDDKQFSHYSECKKIHGPENQAPTEEEIDNLEFNAIREKLLAGGSLFD